MKVLLFSLNSCPYEWCDPNLLYPENRKEKMIAIVELVKSKTKILTELIWNSGNAKWRTSWSGK